MSDFSFVPASSAYSTVSADATESITRGFTVMLSPANNVSISAKAKINDRYLFIIPPLFYVEKLLKNYLRVTKIAKTR